jgi:hypothetical protein
MYRRAGANLCKFDSFVDSSAGYVPQGAKIRAGELAKRMGMITRLIASVSAIVSGTSGVVLLFAADVALPLLTGLPPGAIWLAQLVGAAWLGIAALNWLSRGATLGGIYGRPVVIANVAAWFITSTVLLKAPFAAGPVAALVPGAFAALYGVLLFRGPFDSRRG